LGLLSDIVLASDTAQFQDAPHFSDGVVPGDSVQLVWQMLLGPNRGRYFLLTGQKLSAQEALALGVVSEVLSKDKLLGRAWEWARYITARPTLTRRYARVVLTQMLKQQMLEHVSHGVALEGLAGSVSWGMGGKSTN
jgi:enoyl-CoA hydratase/carnithine racemase